MGILHPIRPSDCQLRPWNHPKPLDLDIDIQIDERQLQKQIEKKTDEVMNRIIKRLNGK